MRISGGASCRERNQVHTANLSLRHSNSSKRCVFGTTAVHKTSSSRKPSGSTPGTSQVRRPPPTWPPALASVLRGTVQDTENRICRLLFKLAVEQDMVMNVLAAGMELPNEQFHAMRGRCVQDVKKPVAVSRWVTLSAIRGAVCDHPHPVQILRCKTKNKSPRKK